MSDGNRRWRLLFYTVYLVITVVFLAAAWPLPPGSRLLPMAALILLGVLLVLRIVGVVRPGFEAALDRWTGSQASIEGGPGPGGFPTRPTMATVLWWSAGAVAMYLLGYLVGPACFWQVLRGGVVDGRCGPPGSLA